MAAGVSLYEVIEVEPTASVDEITAAIAAARRKWQSRVNSPKLEQRQLAEQRMALIAEAERVLLDPPSRAQYDASGSSAPSTGQPRFIIWSSESAGTVKLDLMRILEVDRPSPGPFVPVIDRQKAPVLQDGELYYEQLVGEATFGYQAWPNAPWEEVSGLIGNTAAYFTSHGLIYICPEFVPAQQARDYSRWAIGDGTEILGHLARAASQARNNANARREAVGRALGGVIPWEYVYGTSVAPATDGWQGAILQYFVSAGDAQYQLMMCLEGADLQWARQFAEWTVGLAMHRRLAVYGDGIFPSERDLIGAVMATVKPEYQQDGTLWYDLPVALDGAHALTLV